MIALIIALQTADVAPIVLRCDGVGSMAASETTQVNAFDNRGNAAYGSASRATVRSFPEHLRLTVDGAGSHIEVPPSLRPPISGGGGQTGSWPLYEVRVTDSEIVGRFRLNVLNKPLVRIDRSTGGIDAEGKFGWAFHGTCGRDDPSARKF